MEASRRTTPDRFGRYGHSRRRRLARCAPGEIPIICQVQHEEQTGLHAIELATRAFSVKPSLPLIHSVVRGELVPAERSGVCLGGCAPRRSLWISLVGSRCPASVFNGSCGVTQETTGPPAG